DDLALGLDVDSVLNFRPLTGIDLKSAMLQPRLVSQWCRVERRIAAIPGSALRCLREDGQSRQAARPENNIDLSEALSSRPYPRYTCFWTSHCFVCAINHFDTIETDRLHVAIAASLLGKRVLLKRGNYYKNEAVFEHSLKGRFPNTSLAH